MCLQQGIITASDIPLLLRRHPAPALLLRTLFPLAALREPVLDCRRMSPNAPQNLSPHEPERKSRRWFLRGLLGVGCLAAAGKGVDWVLPRTLCRAGEWHGPVTDHFDGTHFFNAEPNKDYGTRAALRWWLDRPARGVYPVVDRNRFQPELAPSVEGREWEITMVNHSTLLIRTRGLNILTDPIWSDYTSPIQGIGPRRTRPPGLAWDKLPHIDICLLSHDHYDHFDVKTLQALVAKDRPLFVLPLGLKSLLEYHCGEGLSIRELDWWQSVSVDGLNICLTPARHWSKRYRTAETANRSLWGGFWLSSPDGPSLYFAGDTSWTRWFEVIRKRLGAPDMALLPIGAYKPDWIRNNHTSPADAVRAFQTLHARRAIACHFGTWQMANEGYQETLDDLSRALREAGIAPERFIAPENGQTLRGRV